MSKHKFKDSLAVGKAGEALLQKLWPELVPTDGRKGDFMLNELKLEVKSDSYDANKTSNLFLERFSDFDKKKPGGPWQSLEHGAELFFYWFPGNKLGYLFKTSALVTFLEENEHLYKPVLIDNVHWVTIGYKVPVDSLKHLYIKKEWK